MLKMIIGAGWKNQENEKKKELIMVFQKIYFKKLFKKILKN